MNVVGLDLSLAATGVAGIDGEPSVYKPRALAGPARLVEIRRHILQVTADAHFTVLEGYAFGRINRAHELGELGGVIRVALFDLKRPYVVVAPSSLKKYACGKGNASKGEVLAAAIRRLGYMGFDHNEADSLFLRQIGLHVSGDARAVFMPQTHLEAIAAIRLPLAVAS